MAQPNQDQNDPFGSPNLWELLNTPLSELNNQALKQQQSDAAESKVRNQKRAEKAKVATTSKKSAEKTPVTPRAKKVRSFTNRHGQKREPKPAKKHTFHETTNRIGFTPAPDTSPIKDSDEHRTEKSEKKLHKPGIFTLFFGVFLPVLSMWAELSTHQLAKTFLDPFPTFNHVLLFSLIPISNLLTWLAVRRNLSTLYSMIALSSGMALGIAILYSVMLWQLTPMFLLLSLTAGIGILGLAPLLAIPVTLMCGGTICQLSDRHKTFFDAHQLKHLGHVIILVMVIAVELPSSLTRNYMGLAQMPDKSTQAIQWLRQWGNRDVMLRACYERSGEATDVLGTFAEMQRPVPVESARRLYYQVTGVSYNSVPIPQTFRGTIRNAGLISDPAGLNADVEDEFDLDPDIAGELVSGVARGLSVSDSSIAGTLDSANGVAMLDWNFTFENVSTIPREARAKILLPPNAVVTKATLWLDDWQKETVIQERGLARQTYQDSVASHKRDPLLVSMDGKDSVLVQCYPVVKGTKTKIRLHIVSPLVVTNEKQESLLMPTFEERNFAITIPHKVALSSKNKLDFAGTDAKIAERAGLFDLIGTVDNSMMSRFESVVKVARPGYDGESTQLTMRPPETAAQARLALYSQLPDNIVAARDIPVVKRVGDTPKCLTVIIDRSVTMQPYMKDIVAALQSTPESLALTIIQVKDGYSVLCSQANSENYQKALKTLAEEKCEGGQSDTDALEWVFHQMYSTGYRADARNDVLWIHAAQPVGQAGYWTQNTLRTQSPLAPSLYDLQVASGPNELLKESYDMPRLSRLVRTGKLSDDITSFLENYSKNQVRKCATMFSVNKGSTNPEVAQVQAYKLALARYLNGDKWGAYDLASRYHLVTPVSSAVVTDEPPELIEEEKEAAKRDADDQVSKAFAKMNEGIAPLANNSIYEDQSKVLANNKDLESVMKAPAAPAVAGAGGASGGLIPSRGLPPVNWGKSVHSYGDNAQGDAQRSDLKQYANARRKSQFAALDALNSMSSAAPSSVADGFGLDRGAMDKTRFYNSPRQMQIVDEKPMVSDYRQQAETKKKESYLSSVAESGVTLATPKSEPMSTETYYNTVDPSSTPTLQGASNGLVSAPPPGYSEPQGKPVDSSSSVFSAQRVRPVSHGFLDATMVIYWIAGVFTFLVMFAIFRIGSRTSTDNTLKYKE